MFKIVSKEEDLIWFRVFGKLFHYRYLSKRLTHIRKDSRLFNFYYLLRNEEGREFILHTYVDSLEYTRFEGLLNLIGRLLPKVIILRRGYRSFGEAPYYVEESMYLPDILKREALDEEWVKSKGYEILDRSYTSNLPLKLSEVDEVLDSIKQPDLLYHSPLDKIREIVYIRDEVRDSTGVELHLTN